jgi:RNA 2',3'-cyclic 3'-phosphodiesterase
VSARLFAALELPERARSRLAAFGRAAAEGDRALRAVGEEALHVTLAFLGDRAEDDVSAARSAVRGLAGSPAPALALGEVLWLPARSPHVLTVEVVEGEGVLAALQADVAGRLAQALDWEPEGRRFRPHITVARVRRGGRPRTRALPEGPRASFAGEAVVLYRSHLGEGPARYEALERASLG